MTAVIRVDALTKSYGSKRGVVDLSFDVHPGEVFGFLGPNGAGKTTTMRTLLDFLRPTSGNAEVFGLDSHAGRETIHAKTGYLPGDPGLEGRLTGEELLRHLAHLRGDVDWERVLSLCERLDADLSRPLRTLSRGNKQKIAIIQAFMHDPELLMLDEPTSGLDPLKQQEFNDIIRESRARGRTVFLSSHILSEVEALCDRVGIIRDGRLAMVETVANVKARAVRRVHARFASAADARGVTDLPNVSNVILDGANLHCDARGELGPLVKVFATRDLIDLTTKEPALEDVFMAFYEENESDA